MTQPTSYAYQWSRSGTAISGATKNTYLVTGADAAQEISCTVTGSNSVGSTASTSAATTAVAAKAVGPSGVAMPVGDLAGWTQLFADDFTTDFAAGAVDTVTGDFPAPYDSSWTCYTGFTDTSGAGTYDANILSVSDSCLTMYLHTSGGVVHVGAPLPVLPGHAGAYQGQTYGRYDICMKADAGLTGYQAAYLLWTDSDTWSDGEIDFPNSDLATSVWGYTHNVTGDPGANAMWSHAASTFYTSWHVYTIEWRPKSVTLLVDGAVLGTCTAAEGGVPAVPMHLVLQTETDGGAPEASIAGHTYVDWVTIYAPA